MEDIRQLIDKKIELHNIEIAKLTKLKDYIDNPFIQNEEVKVKVTEEEPNELQAFLQEHQVKNEMQLCKKFGVSFSDFKRLLREGMSPKDALKNAQIKE